MQYAYQAAAFLQALKAKASAFTAADPVKCNVFSRLETLNMAYQVGCGTSSLSVSVQS